MRIHNAITTIIGLYILLDLFVKSEKRESCIAGWKNSFHSVASFELGWGDSKKRITSRHSSSTRQKNTVWLMLQVSSPSFNICMCGDKDEWERGREGGRDSLVSMQLVSTVWSPMNHRALSSCPLILQLPPEQCRQKDHVMHLLNCNTTTHSHMIFSTNSFRQSSLIK